MLPETSDPDGLTMDVPRDAKFTTKTQAARLFLLALLLLTVGLLWWLANRDLGDLNALRAHGQVTLARIDDKHITHEKSDSYHIGYDFHEKGVRVDGDKVVDQDEYADARPGETLPVTFLPSHPETYRLGAVTQARIEAQRGRWLWSGLAAFALFGLMLACAEATFRQHLALLRDGSVAAGTVTDRLYTGIQQGRHLVTYQFTAGGRLYSKKRLCAERFYRQAERGQALTILYDPARPSRNIPYRMLTDVALSER